MEVKLNEKWRRFSFSRKHECGVLKVYDSEWVLIDKHDVKNWKPLEF